MKRTVTAVAIMICSVFAQNANAQVSDAGLWLSFNLEKKFTQKVSLNFTEELRFNENISELGTVFSDLGLTYKLNGNIRASANYRFSNKRRVDDSYSTRHRYYADVTLRKKFGNIIPSYRVRFQSQSDMLNRSDNDGAEYYLRNRLLLKYSPDKQYKPYVGVELFTQLHSDVFKRSVSDNVRFSAGVDYELNERNALGLGYLVEREFNRNDPGRNYVLTLSYGLSL